MKLEHLPTGAIRVDGSGRQEVEEALHHKRREMLSNAFEMAGQLASLIKVRMADGKVYYTVGSQTKDESAGPFKGEFEIILQRRAEP